VGVLGSVGSGWHQYHNGGGVWAINSHFKSLKASTSAEVASKLIISSTSLHKQQREIRRRWG
jgi:hypothetical protein